MNVGPNPGYQLSYTARRGGQTWFGRAAIVTPDTDGERAAVLMDARSSASRTVASSARAQSAARAISVARCALSPSRAPRRSAQRYGASSSAVQRRWSAAVPSTAARPVAGVSWSGAGPGSLSVAWCGPAATSVGAAIDGRKALRCPRACQRRACCWSAPRARWLGRWSLAWWGWSAWWPPADRRWWPPGDRHARARASWPSAAPPRPWGERGGRRARLSRRAIGARDAVDLDGSARHRDPRQRGPQRPLWRRLRRSCEGAAGCGGGPASSRTRACLACTGEWPKDALEQEQDAGGGGERCERAVGVLEVLLEARAAVAVLHVAASAGGELREEALRLLSQLEPYLIAGEAARFGGLGQPHTGAHQQRLDGGHRGIHRHRDLLVGEIVDLAQQDRGALGFRQSLNIGQELAHLGALVHRLGRSDPLVDDRELHPLHAHHRLAPQVVQAAVARDAVQPGPHVDRTGIAEHRAVGRGEDLLQHTPSASRPALLPSMWATERQEPDAVARNEHLKRCLVAAPHMRHQALVRLQAKQRRGGARRAGARGVQGAVVVVIGGWRGAPVPV